MVFLGILGVLFIIIGARCIAIGINAILAAIRG